MSAIAESPSANASATSLTEQVRQERDRIAADVLERGPLTLSGRARVGLWCAGVLEIGRAHV
jgi:hypothetical protein